MKMSRAEYMQMRSKFELAISTALVQGKEEYRLGLLAGLEIFEETFALLPHSQKEWKEYTRQDIGRRLREYKQEDIPIKHQGKFVREEFRDSRLTTNAHTDYETFSSREERKEDSTATLRYFSHKSLKVHRQKTHDTQTVNKQTTNTQLQTTNTQLQTTNTQLQSVNKQTTQSVSSQLQTNSTPLSSTRVEIRVTTGRREDDLGGTREVLVLGTAPFMKHTYRLVQIPTNLLDKQIEQYLSAKQIVYTEEEWHLRLSMGWFQKRYRPVDHLS